MVAATQNKRGRPKSSLREVVDKNEWLFPCDSTRTRMNSANVGMCYFNLPEEQRSFFCTANGKTRHTGIAEQIGRLYEAELITKDEIPELASACIDLYEKGYSVKEIEKLLRKYRLEELKKTG